MLTMQFSRGDVVLVLFPDSNLRTAKRRPALVVQAEGIEIDRAIGDLPDMSAMNNALRKTLAL